MFTSVATYDCDYSIVTKLEWMKLEKYGERDSWLDWEDNGKLIYATFRFHFLYNEQFFDFRIAYY